MDYKTLARRFVIIDVQPWWLSYSQVVSRALAKFKLSSASHIYARRSIKYDTTILATMCPSLQYPIIPYQCTYD
eukprot:3749968-Pleurochrysis_carterae.AAC.4